FPKWVRIIVGAYYLVITTIFITGHHLIHEKYNMYHGPVIHDGWEVNSNWAFFFSFVYIIPMGILVFYTFLYKVKASEGLPKQWTRPVIFLIIWAAVLFFLFVLFNIA